MRDYASLDVSTLTATDSTESVTLDTDAEYYYISDSSMVARTADDLTLTIYEAAETATAISDYAQVNLEDYIATETEETYTIDSTVSVSVIEDGVMAITDSSLSQFSIGLGIKLFLIGMIAIRINLNKPVLRAVCRWGHEHFEEEQNSGKYQLFKRYLLLLASVGCILKKLEMVNY